MCDSFNMPLSAQVSVLWISLSLALLVRAVTQVTRPSLVGVSMHLLYALSIRHPAILLLWRLCLIDGALYSLFGNCIGCWFCTNSYVPLRRVG